MKNQLHAASSPYLLQHADQPVHWRMWGEQAFQAAREQNRPVFLSIGYSTCHWCHVMAHESFDDAQTAEFLNQHFVSIKVDREEMPDVDATFMAYIQAVSGHGGWPMSIWLTPEGDPIFGGTYFPPAARGGMASFSNICEQVIEIWSDDSSEVKQKSAQMLKRLQEHAKSVSSEIELSNERALKKLVATCLSYADEENGGFGRAPKFPRPALLRALSYASAQKHLSSDDRYAARKMFVEALDAIIKGGIHDHLGGGFHRYTVDEFWHVPHFEKMLYDQAQLIKACIDAFIITKKPRYREVAEKTLDYVLRDLTHAKGGFFCGEDADSFDPAVNHNKEGAFWIWRSSEVFELLDPRAAQLFAAKYGLQHNGNIRPESDPQEEFGEGNVLFAAMDDEALASVFSMDLNECKTILEDARRVLFSQREKRQRPHRDDKVILSWNAMMLSSLSYGARVFRTAQWSDAAERCYNFIKNELWDGVQLYRSWRETRSDIKAFPVDYAQLIAGLLDYYEAFADEDALAWARGLQDQMIVDFWSDDQGGFVLRSFWGDKNLLEMREDYDGAEPSTQSVACMNLIKLSYLSEHHKDLEYAKKILSRSSSTLAENPYAVPLMIIAKTQMERGLVKVSIERTGAYWGVLNEHYSENVIIGAAQELPSLCVGETCFMPARSLEVWSEQLEKYLV